MKKLIYFIVLSIAFISCEEEMVPMLPRVVPPADRVVLIEDFTGVACSNCPKGARLIENLKAQYPGSIVSLAVYTRGFDNREPESKYDFRTDVGQALQDNIEVLFGKPSAAINRIIDPVNGRRFFGIPESWTAPVLEELQRPVEMNVTLTTEYDPSTRTVSGNFTMIPTKNFDEQISYTVVIAENNIIDPQNDNDEIILDYEHNHVLRDVLTDPTGDVLGTTFATGDIISRDFSYTLPDEDGWWVAENCEIIAFAHLSEGQERRVLQAAKEKVVK